MIEVERTVNASGNASLGDHLISVGLPLAGHALTVIAACSVCDSAAFRADDGRFAIVHLTWSLHQEPPLWPSAGIVTGSHGLEAAADEHADSHQD